MHIYAHRYYISCGYVGLSSDLKKFTVVDESLFVSINPMFCYENTFKYSMKCQQNEKLTQILYQYHDSLFAGYQDATRMYLALKEKFYANSPFNSIRKYVQSCHTCHTRSAKEPGYKSYHTRIPYDFRPMSRISADIKWIPLSNQGFNYICLLHVRSQIM